MENGLGGSEPFVMSEARTPITYGLAQYFNASDERLTLAGEGVKGFAAITQDNFARVIRAIADLELEVQALKAERKN